MKDTYQIEAVAIGSGTAGRETEELVRSLGWEGVQIFLVSEDGASVYSASKLAREKNAGWRIDYFLVSDRLRPALTDAAIHGDVFGSDHCPVSVEIDFSQKTAPEA